MENNTKGTAATWKDFELEILKVFLQHGRIDFAWKSIHQLPLIGSLIPIICGVACSSFEKVKLVGQKMSVAIPVGILTARGVFKETTSIGVVPEKIGRIGFFVFHRKGKVRYREAVVKSPPARNEPGRLKENRDLPEQ
jgi:hypothetical protein